MIDRIHHVGDAAAFRFRREAARDPDDSDAAEDRHEDDERAERADRSGRTGCRGEGKLAEEEEIMETDQHGAEDHRADPGGEAHGERQHGEDNHVDLARVVSRIGRPAHILPRLFREITMT